MPVRNKAIATIASYLGSQEIKDEILDLQIGCHRNQPSLECVQALQAADDLFLELVMDIDWQRIILEAQSRMFAVKQYQNTKIANLAPHGEDVLEALLSDAKMTSDWSTRPTAPRTRDLHKLYNLGREIL